MQLLELDDGQTSLELSVDELDELFLSLQGLRGFSREPRASYEVVCILGSELVLTNDWDEPCLLSRDTLGATILRAIALGESLRMGRGTTRRALSSG